nr:hypothetical protein [Flavobacterium sp. N1736]
MRKVKNEVFTSNIQTIGLLVDESKFRHSNDLVNALIGHGIAPQNIKIVTYRDKIKKKKTYSETTFGKKDINWKGGIKVDFLTDFVETEFDLLISYYEIEKPILMMITGRSKARFKVGFASVDDKLNRWMINTDLENYKLFISELFKYLKSIK